VTVTVANAEVTGVKNGNTALTAATHYTWTTGTGTLTIKKGYLSTLTASQSPVILTILTDNGTVELAVAIEDTTT
jgi:uncharacterized membrane protein